MATLDRANLTIDLKGAAALRAALDRKQEGLGRRGSAFHKAVIMLDAWVQRNFQTEGKMAYPGDGWKPLAPSTIAGRRSQGRYQNAARERGKDAGSATVRILQDVGWLRSRWRHIWNDRMALIQSGVDYGVYHDSDEPRSGRLPQRKILPREKQVMPELLRIFGDFVRTNLDK